MNRAELLVRMARLWATGHSTASIAGKLGFSESIIENLLPEMKRTHPHKIKNKTECIRCHNRIPPAIGRRLCRQCRYEIDYELD